MPSGAGSAAKLVNNLLSLGTHVLQLETMQLAEAYALGRFDEHNSEVNQ
jgi:3-hydroxyisobutyrate dehydrogenase-like beta-hydroxyacid dehydrogenase